LPEASLNTFYLLLGVGSIALVLGTGCAWLVTAYTFPGRRVLAWALLLPLAMPSYIVAFAYSDLLHPIGPVQTVLRTLLGYDSPRQWRLPDIRSLWGAIVLLGLVLYPYVYLSARAAFLSQSAHLMEAARSLGYTPWGVLRRVVLPLARPALVVGLSLALLETLNDIGASEFLGVHTLTVSIYTTWVTRSDLAGAAQIALCMLTVVLLLISLEQHGRARMRFASVQGQRRMRPKRLRGLLAVLALGVAVLPVLLGFVAPASYLVYQSVQRLAQTGHISAELLASLGNTLALALAVTACAMLGGLLVAWASRQGLHSMQAPRWPVRLASLGYAVPGTVLAIGLLPPALKMDGLMAEALGLPGLPLMSAGVLVLLGCSLRFVAIGANSIQAGLLQQPPGLEQAARLLGEKPLGVLRRVQLPLLRPALGSAAMLVFVDAMKELPATLLLRPANFETLSTWLYAEAARGTYEEGAIAALGIVLAGIIPVIVLARQQEGKATSQTRK
ncbi:MAG: iron ABC transporter permease, partial [Brachymonas sp.]|nr:iron ABC transporter permease [Brachymonas sp.]